MKSHRAALSLLLVASLSLPVLAGCKKIEQAVEPKPRVVTREATVAAPAAPTEGSLPEGAPANLPVWPGSTVTSGDASGGAVTVTMETTSAYKDVVAGTSVGFTRAGWDVSEAGREASATVLDVTGEGYDGVLTLTDVGGKVTLDYLLTKAAGN